MLKGENRVRNRATASNDKTRLTYIDTPGKYPAGIRAFFAYMRGANGNIQKTT